MIHKSTVIRLFLLLSFASSAGAYSVKVTNYLREPIKAKMQSTLIGCGLDMGEIAPGQTAKKVASGYCKLACYRKLSVVVPKGGQVEELTSGANSLGDELKGSAAGIIGTPIGLPLVIFPYIIVKQCGNFDVKVGIDQAREVIAQGINSENDRSRYEFGQSMGPQGTYRSSCYYCQLTGTELSCHCLGPQGFNQTSLNLLSCGPGSGVGPGEDIDNVRGNLACSTRIGY